MTRQEERERRRQERLARELVAEVKLVHPDGTRVWIHLPASVSTVAEAMIALGELGYMIEREPDVDQEHDPAGQFG